MFHLIWVFIWIGLVAVTALGSIIFAMAYGIHCLLNSASTAKRGSWTVGGSVVFIVLFGVLLSHNPF